MPKPMIGAVVVGDLARIKRTYDPTRIKKLAIRYADELLKDESKRYKAELKRTIRGQMPNWPALSPVTIAIKGHALILIDTKQLVNDFAVNRRGRWRVEVGIRKTRKRRDGTSLLELGLKHEFGDGEVPARPFNQPTFDRVEPQIISRAVGRFLNLMEKLRKDRAI